MACVARSFLGWTFGETAAGPRYPAPTFLGLSFKVPALGSLPTNAVKGQDAGKHLCRQLL